MDSTITIQHTDGTCESVSCRWDGHLGWNGQLLYAFYNTAEKVQELINHGKISSLGMNIGEQIDSKAFDDDPKRTTNFQCTFFARDRGNDLNIVQSESVDKLFLIGGNFNYVFSEKEGIWYAYDGDMENKRPLKDAIAQDLIDFSIWRCIPISEYLLTPNSCTEFSPLSSKETTLIKDVATAEQLARLSAANEEIVQKADELCKGLTLTRCEFAEVTEALLAANEMCVAAVIAKDKNDNEVGLWVVTTGDGHNCDLELSIRDRAENELVRDRKPLEIDVKHTTSGKLKNHLVDCMKQFYEEHAGVGELVQKQKNNKERDDVAK